MQIHSTSAILPPTTLYIPRKSRDTSRQIRRPRRHALSDLAACKLALGYFVWRIAQRTERWKIFDSRIAPKLHLF